jgi:serine O-acetyltransferase
MSQDTESLVPAGLTAELLETYQRLGDSFHGLRGVAMPSTEELRAILDLLREVLFPGMASGIRPKGAELRGYVEARLHEVALRLRRQLCFGQQYVRLQTEPDRECEDCEDCADRMTRELLAALPTLRETLTKDAQAAMAGDPAARDLGEILLSYPGHYAVTIYRIAHALWQLGAPLVPRIMTEIAHRLTGIDIHPGATIGEWFFIDHGTGVVVGETTVIGSRVRLYQGVTLGALSLPASRVQKLRGGTKRHPTLEDDVIVYAGATILGGETTIGAGSIIGGNCWVVESVAAGSRVSVQVSTEVRPPQPRATPPASPPDGP